MLELLNFISTLISLYTYVIFGAVIMSFLLVFNVINARNTIVQSVWNVPIRRFLPDFGAIDMSPVVVLLGLYFIQSVVLPNIAKIFL